MRRILFVCALMLPNAGSLADDAQESVKEKALFNLRAIVFSDRNCPGLAADAATLADFVSTLEKIGLDPNIAGSNKDILKRDDEVLANLFSAGKERFCAAAYTQYGPNILRRR